MSLDPTYWNDEFFTQRIITTEVPFSLKRKGRRKIIEKIRGIENETIYTKRN
jgi:hypothetical protein